MHMRLFTNSNLKKYLLTLAVLTLSLVFLPSSYALAADDTTSVTPTADTTASNNNDQTAAVGDSTVSSQSSELPASPASPAPADQTPSVAATDTTPTPDATPATTTSDTGTTPAPVVVPTEGCVNPNTTTTQPSGQQDASASSGGGAADVNATTNSGINNNICSSATSGDASVTNNGSAGNATSGDAQSIANIINILQSVTGLSGGNLATFIQNVYGDQFGDIHIDPATLNYLLGGGCSLCSGGGSINSTNNGQINNDIYLGANSGNAGVSNNGIAGNATSGNATALLNLVNIINSAIAANNSFVGVINIYGNLNGDILFPPDLLNSLFGPGSSGGSGSGPPDPSNTNINVNNDQSINNNVILDASSGSAKVADNHHAGDATTGDASTSLKIFNLTGSQVIGKNALLVFVNVLGKWVGMIMNAPAGATSAALGSGISDTGCLCSGGLDANINNNDQINNNIYLSATSGDATVTGNRRAGNATSGNATASANIVNIISSQLSFSDWFGILFINVFGTWNGSFGIDTAAGNTPDTSGSTGGSSSDGPSTPVPQVAQATTGGGHVVYGASTTGSSAGQTDDNQSNGGVLGTYTGPKTPSEQIASSLLGNILTAAIGGLCCFALLGLVGRRQKGQRQIQMLPNVIQPSL